MPNICPISLTHAHTRTQAETTRKTTRLTRHCAPPPHSHSLCHTHTLFFFLFLFLFLFFSRPLSHTVPRVKNVLHDIGPPPIHTLLPSTHELPLPLSHPPMPPPLPLLSLSPSLTHTPLTPTLTHTHTHFLSYTQVPRAKYFTCGTCVGERKCACVREREWGLQELHDMRREVGGWGRDPQKCTRRD